MTTWHASEDTLERFARAPETLDAPTGSSLELHLVGCPSCRSAVARHSDDAFMVASWDRVADEIDAPAAGFVERLLRLIHVSEGNARIVSATPALRRSWFIALATLVAGVIGLSRQLDDPGPYLVIAPLVPLAAVALAFWPDADPGGEAGRGTPLAGFALALRRTVAVLVPSVLIVLLGSLALPGAALIDGAWLLPALGLSAGAVALSTWTRVDIAAIALAGSWLALLASLHVRQSLPTEQLAVFTAGGQLVWLVASAFAVVVIAVRRDSFVYSGRSS